MQALGPTDPTQIGSWRIVGFIGKGGMGRVYLGILPSGQQAAIKVMTSGTIDERTERVRFRREIDMAKRVSGRYTARILDADADAADPWYASEYIAGPTLEEAIVGNGGNGLPEAAVHKLASVLVRALAEIHAQGIVHRDLKPQNVIIGPDGPRVIDFGIAHMEDLTKLTTSGVLGTPSYMCPEQLEGKDPRPAWDIFALGALLTYAATGHTPFPGNTRVAIYMAILNSPPNLSGVPSSLTDLIRKCLSKKPAERQSLASIRSYLETVTADWDGIGWLPNSVKEQVAKTEEQTRKLAALSGDVPTRPYPKQQPSSEQRLVRDIIEEHQARRAANDAKAAAGVRNPEQASQPRQGGGKAGKTMLMMGLLVLVIIGVFQFGAPALNALQRQAANGNKSSSTSKPTQAAVDPSLPALPRFTVASKVVGPAYDRADSPANVLTITKVKQVNYYLELSVTVRNFDQFVGDIFRDSCVRIKGKQWSGTQLVGTYAIDSAERVDPIVARLIIPIEVSGGYTFVPNCKSASSVITKYLGKAAAKNQGVVTNGSEMVAVLKAVRSGGGVTITLRNFDMRAVDSSFCLRTAKGFMDPSNDASLIVEQTDPDRPFRVIAFENAPSGGKLYLASCDDLRAKQPYNGRTVTLP